MFALLGVLAAVHGRSFTDDVVETGTGLAVEFAEPIDLGIVYRASTITETVDQLLEESGHTRAATDSHPTTNSE